MLAVLTTHPIQYQVPLWKALADRDRVPMRVLYMNDQGLNQHLDPGFGRRLAWDIDLLAGYDHEFIDVWEGRSQDSFLWLKLQPNFGKTLKDRGASVLWIQGWQVAAYWQAVWQARRAGIEVWLRGETNLRSQKQGPLKGLKRVLLRRLLARVDRFLYIGEANRQFYRLQSVPPNRMISAPYCVDNARFRSEASRLRQVRTKLRKQWGIPDKAFCFLFVGKLIPKKRPGDLVAAVHGLQLRGIQRSLHILFVGTGELDTALRRMCTVAVDAEGRNCYSGNPLPQASFTGFLNQSEVSQAYVAADCLVLPSDARETWGLVVNEALASGLPCVVSDACGCAEDLILPICPELSYPAGNVAALQRCLESVMNNAPSIDLLQRHIDNFDLLHTVESVEQLYRDAIARRAA